MGKRELLLIVAFVIVGAVVYGAEVAVKLAEAGVRAELDDRSESLGYRVREAQLQKIPYMLVVGAREMEAGTVAVRRRAGADLGAMPVDAFADRLKGLVEARSLEL